MKSEKRRMTEEMELPNKENIRMLWEKKTYEYLGILKMDNMKQVEMKEKNEKEYLRRTRKPLEKYVAGTL